MSALWIYNDGGRREAGYKGSADDCVTRAIAIATGQPYLTVYDDLFALIRNDRRRKKGNTPRSGVSDRIWKPYLTSLGWQWTPTMRIGSGCTVHLRADELPSGRLVVACSRHLVAVIDGVIHDTGDPSRDGTRCVYGYFRNPEHLTDEHDESRL